MSKKSVIGNKGIKSRKRNWKAIIIALYITFLLLSMIPFAADRAVEPQMKDSYTYHLRYPQDGRQSHYYVERVDTSEVGKIDLTYTTSSNSLEVDVENLKVLWIYCRSMYEDECNKVYNIDPYDNSNYFKWYFIEKNHLNVNINSDNKIEELRFIDTPLPYKVLVNNVEWKESEKYNYTSDFSTAISDVPSGRSRVDIYFKPESGLPPVAILNASKTVVAVNHTIDFDASGSYDPDGSILAYIFDFGDGTFKGGSEHTHYYSTPGTYGVILTVRDNNNLVAYAYKNITVVKTSNIPEIQSLVPNQIKDEDSPPWTLDLVPYQPISFMSGVKFRWYLSGQNSSLYTVTGINSTDNRLVFTPVPDAYGNDLVTLFLSSSENITDSQPLWINITSINDPPTISAIPDLILHYDDEYTFNYEPYVDDKETPRNDLILSIFDGFEEKYITLDGIKATFTYPHELVGEVIYATLMVSDGEDVAQKIFTIQVTSDYVPKLIKSLPDVWLFEGTTKENVFDLDDYFTDPDNDAIYFSYGTTHLTIIIQPDHTVDITAESEWTGSELVTFRARDPIGAIAEDSIVITVLPVNDPPIIENVPDFIIHYDYDYRFDLTPYVHDNDNSSSDLTIIPSDPEHIRLDILNNLVIILNYPEEYLGKSETVRLTVTDGLDSSFQDVTVTVTVDYPPELITPLPDVVFLEDMPLINAFDLDSYFLDVDGDVLYYTTGNKFVSISINSDQSVDFTAPKDWFGMESVYFRATDPTGALQQDLVMVTVLPVNDPPKISAIPPQYGNESERWVLNLESYINDVDNNISDLEITLDNEFIVISGYELIFLGTRDLPDTVIVTVSDGQYEASRSFEVNVKLNKAPKSVTLWDLFLNLLPFLIIIVLLIIGIAGIIYHKKSKFEAEEVFLIHKGGTLINHLMRHSTANVDDVIFSGMFTAVQEFIKDTFSKDNDPNQDQSEDSWVLDELSLGENKILIERSENTYLAVIFSGQGSKRLRKIVNKLLDKIETKYENILPTWEGDIRALSGTKEILSMLIKVEEKPEKPQFVPMKPVTTSLKPSQSQLVTPKPPVSSPPPAKPVKTQRMYLSSSSTETKGLLEFLGKQFGANRPGLIAWPMRKDRNYGNADNERGLKLKNPNKTQFPMAFGISPRTEPLKTISMKKPYITPKTPHQSNNVQSLKQKAPSILNTTNCSKPVTITMPNSDEKFKLDPNKSLMLQLAELEEKNNM
jgi:hypothetical protein